MTIDTLAKGDANREQPGTLRHAHGLILFELDDFAAFEQLFGEDTATAIIYDAEARIWSALPEGAGSWQAGRGQFAVSLPTCAEADLSGIAQRVQASIGSRPLLAPAGEVAVTASAGCALADPEDLTRLGRTAQRALTDAKRAGNGSCEIRVAGADDAAAILEAAQACLAAGRLLVAFQPVRRANGMGPVSFHECLLRMPNEGAEPLVAARFLPGLVGAGCAPEVDRMVLCRALGLLTKHPLLRLSVNVAAETLADQGWIGELEARSAADLSLAARLIAEIDASALLARGAETTRFLERLRATGACLAVDGLGRTALGARLLADLRPDMVKIPLQDPDARSRAQELAALARRLDLAVVATGVESERDGALIRAAGIDFAQGYRLGAPDLAPHFGAGAGIASGEVTFSPDPFPATASRSAPAFR